MRQKERIWWVSASVLSLAALAFFAGLGMRDLFNRLTWSEALASASPSYPRIASADPRVPAEPDTRPGELFTEVLTKLRLYYVEPLPSNTRLATGSLEAMLNQLDDPNSRLVSRAEVDTLQGISQGEFRGLGAVLTVRRFAGRKAEEVEAEVEAMEDPAREAPANRGMRMVTVVSVAPGGPAARAGIQPGDRITEIDGRWVAPIHLSHRVLTQYTDPVGLQDGPPREADELPVPTQKPDERARLRKEAEEQAKRWSSATDLASALELLNSDDKGTHELTVERGNPVQTLKVKVEFGPTRVPVVAHRKLDESTGYLQILAMSGAAVAEAGEALDGFRKDGVSNLVMDLRGSVGGSIEAGREIASLLLGDGRFASLKERDSLRKLVERPLQIQGSAVRFKPSAISVLVDGGTAGTSELLAAALRENAGARLVGSTTFGDGTEQELVRLENGMGISITRARMLTSRGVDFEGKGLQPDIAAQGDALQAALKALGRAAAAQN